jgi:hypothetical protein
MLVLRKDRKDALQGIHGNYCQAVEYFDLLFSPLWFPNL